MLQTSAEQAQVRESAFLCDFCRTKTEAPWHGYHFGDRTDGYLRLAPYLCPVQLN